MYDGRNQIRPYKRLLCVATLMLFGCQSGDLPAQKPIEPVLSDNSDAVYQVCDQTNGISCSINEQLNQLSIAIDRTIPPDETQRGVYFVSRHYCRLSRLSGDENNRVLLIRPNGTQVGRSCSTIEEIE